MIPNPEYVAQSMMPAQSFRSVALAAVIATFACLQAAPASAQSFWDWGGGDQRGGMYNQDVLDLFPKVSIGSRVTVTWQHFTSADEGRRVLRKSGPVVKAVDERVLASLPEAQREPFLSCLRSVIEKLEKSYLSIPTTKAMTTSDRNSSFNVP
jgi:hypothetical protein